MNFFKICDKAAKAGQAFSNFYTHPNFYILQKVRFGSAEPKNRLFVWTLVIMSEGFKLSLSIIQSIAKKLNFSIVFLDLVSFSNLFNNLVRWLRKSSFMHTLLIAESLHSAKIFEKSRNLRIIAITLSIKSSISGFSAYQNET